MTTLEIILIVILWIVLGIFMIYKQYEADDSTPKEILGIGCFIFAPLWFIGAIIRQVFIEDWK